MEGRRDGGMKEFLCSGCMQCRGTGRQEILIVSLGRDTDAATALAGMARTRRHSELCCIGRDSTEMSRRGLAPRTPTLFSVDSIQSMDPSCTGTAEYMFRVCTEVRMRRTLRVTFDDRGVSVANIDVDGEGEGPIQLIYFAVKDSHYTTPHTQLPR